jgi:hypothetical protein
MKWDIDKELHRFEPDSAPGTMLQRVLMDAAVAKREGLHVPDDARDPIIAWSLGVGVNSEPKHFVFGLTIRACFLRLRKLVRAGLPLNPQVFPRLGKRVKKKERGRR